MKRIMEAVQAWIEKYMVPVMNKITSTYWFGIISDAVLYVVPFCMVSAIPSLWSVLRNFIPVLPDISALNTYSFGLIGLFVSFIIPHNVAVKEGKRDRAMIAGFTSIGVYMMCMNAQAVEGGMLFDMNKFGAGGMFTALFVGFIVGFIYKKTCSKSFFGEDSVIPDFVKNWFDNILSVLISLFVGFLLTFVAKVDVFSVVALVMSPITGFAQSLPGVVLIVVIQNMLYFFGISGWVTTPVTRTITQAAIAENAAAMAAGMAPQNIYAYGFSRYHHIGGQGATLPLAVMMLFSKSKKNRMLGKATIVPSLFNINEPLVYASVANNPYMFMPMLLIAIILPTFSYLWFAFGWGTINYVNFDMNFAPNAISAFFMSGGDWRNVVLVILNLIIAALIWYPFFRAWDKNEAKKEEAKLVEREAKKAARAARRAARAEASASKIAGEDPLTDDGEASEIGAPSEA
ncbi:PTS sugar transporter subunit IIC [Collinsella tanakaei]|uniref:PTS sugar transporter subunit IIC n=1 Tax=Collinsella tanakaei TaxID=626935 RepID=UPI003AB2BB25